MATTYALKYRPPGYATLPRGWRDPAPHPVFRFGTVVYDEPLASADVESYELVEIATPERFASLAAELVTDKARYAAEILEMAPDDPAFFKATVGHWLDLRPVYVDRDTFAAQALRLFRERHSQ